MEIPFLGPAYQARSENYSDQRLVNMYLEKGKGKKPWVLIGTPGLTSPLATLTDTSGAAGIRGAIRLSESLSVWVCGDTVHKVTDTFSTSSLGVIANDGLPVTLTYNGINVLIASAGNLYSVSPTGTTATLLRTTVGSVDFIDGFFILNEEGSGKFYISSQYSTSIDSLDFATAEGAPDNIVRVLAQNREAILFGVETTEFWYVSGNADFAMSRIQGAFIEEGIAARHSAVKCGDTVAWLGASKDGDSTVWMLNGYKPVPISTPAIAHQISQWAIKSDAWAFYYKQEDHAFYVLTSPSENQTWAYDFATGEWHRRSYLSAGNHGRARVNTHCFFAGKNLVGDWQNGKIYEYDLDTYSDNGEPISRLRSCISLQTELKNQRNRSFQLDMDVGVGGSAMLRYSKDGGRTWGPELWRSIGNTGEYGRRVKWNRVGGGEKPVFEVTITDPVKVAITGAYLE